MLTKIIEIHPAENSDWNKDLVSKWSSTEHLEITDPLVFVEPCTWGTKNGMRCYFLKDGATYNYFTIHPIVIQP